MNHNQQEEGDISSCIALAAFMPAIKSFAEISGADFQKLVSSFPSSIDYKADSFQQGVIDTAIQMASGFSDESAEAERLDSLLEQIDVSTDSNSQSSNYHYDLKALSPNALFPVLSTDNKNTNTTQAYSALWDEFVTSIDEIPKPHRKNASLWLDHFETLWGTYTHCIPSPVKHVSLFDYSKATVALATALWRFHQDAETLDASELASGLDKKKVVLIQGDFYGIQEFIFASGGKTNRKAAKLLRGRSFYVSLLTECAALKILDALGLPSTSQIINAAGKFMIVAPNTDATIEKLESIQGEYNQWFLDKTWGQSGIGLAWQKASCNDFSYDSYQALITQLHHQLDTAKYHRLDLCNSSTPVFEGYLDSFDTDKGVCVIDGRSPATGEQKDNNWMGLLAKDQIDCGHYIVDERLKRLLITSEVLDRQKKRLQLDIFGYHISFTKEEAESGMFGEFASKGKLLRAWDFSLPDSATDSLWNGYARRNINSYVPVFDETSAMENERGKYANCKEEDFEYGAVKSFGHLACEDRKEEGDNHWQGISALMSLKGDIDNLGLMFQQGFTQPSFLKMATLSRQINAFFAIYLPWLCSSNKDFQNTYTVFAGGDDFFMIGPWNSQIKLARQLRNDFRRYVADNSQVHFSVGLTMTKPGIPIHHLARSSEAALENAKGHNPDNVTPDPKNAVSCFDKVMTWDKFIDLQKREHGLDTFKQDYDLSTGYVYGLLNLVDMKASGKPEDSIWHSYFAYRTRRLLERNRKLDETQRRSQYEYLAKEISSDGIQAHGDNYKVALFTHLYKHRY
jgi:CRISPR-associated protein Csm1